MPAQIAPFTNLLYNGDKFKSLSSMDITNSNILFRISWHFLQQLDVPENTARRGNDILWDMASDQYFNGTWNNIPHDFRDDDIMALERQSPHLRLYYHLGALFKLSQGHALDWGCDGMIAEYFRFRCLMDARHIGEFSGMFFNMLLNGFLLLDPQKLTSEQAAFLRVMFLDRNHWAELGLCQSDDEVTNQFVPDAQLCAEIDYSRFQQEILAMVLSKDS